MRWKRAWTKPKAKAALEARWTEQKQLAEHLLELRQQLAKAREAANRAFEEDAEGTVIALVASARPDPRGPDQSPRQRAPGQLRSLPASGGRSDQRLDRRAAGATGPRAQRQGRSFATDLRTRIRGQEQAVHALDRSMRATAAGLNKPNAPVGVFCWSAQRRRQDRNRAGPG
jgi:type VI secretion system protein VasG